MTSFISRTVAQICFPVGLACGAVYTVAARLISGALPGAMMPAVIYRAAALLNIPLIAALGLLAHGYIGDPRERTSVSERNGTFIGLVVVAFVAEVSFAFGMHLPLLALNALRWLLA